MPPLVIDPTPPSTDHASGGWLASASPNWSFTSAVNRLLDPTGIRIVAGLTVTKLGVGRTSTVTALEIASDPSLIVTRKVYSPARENVTSVIDAAVEPL